MCTTCDDRIRIDQDVVWVMFVVEVLVAGILDLLHFLVESIEVVAVNLVHDGIAVDQTLD